MKLGLPQQQSYHFWFKLFFDFCQDKLTLWSGNSGSINGIKDSFQCFSYFVYGMIYSIDQYYGGKYWQGEKTGLYRKYFKQIKMIKENPPFFCGTWKRNIYASIVHKVVVSITLRKMWHLDTDGCTFEPFITDILYTVTM